MSSVHINTDDIYYFASPYSHVDPSVVENRYLQQGAMVAYLISEMNLKIINPIEMCHNLGKRFGLPQGYTYWKDRDRAFVAVSKGIIVATMDGWNESVGVKDELSYAKELGLQVLFMNPMTMKLTSTPNG